MIHYEFHITVSALDLEKFKQDCQDLGMRYVILELQDANSGEFFQDVQTTYREQLQDDEAAFVKSEGLQQSLRDRGYDVVRSKIEAAPNHPDVIKAYLNGKFREGSYFESHLRVKINDDVVQRPYIDKFAPIKRYHVSRNIYKRIDENSYKLMVTKRSNHPDITAFKKDVSDLAKWLWAAGAIADKIEVEYVLYDSNIAHDDRWVGK
jgi:hypothetical protein